MNAQYAVFECTKAIDSVSEKLIGQILSHLAKELDKKQNFFC